MIDLPKNQVPTIVLVEDSFVVREVVKSLLNKTRINSKYLNLHTSGNGLEGLGLIMVTSPEIAILDTTLPKYSGRELIEFLATNPKFQEKDKKIIATHFDGVKTDLPESYTVLSKTDRNFLIKLFGSMESYIGKPLIRKSLKYKVGLLLGQLAVKWDNRKERWGEIAIHKKSRIVKFFQLGIALISQILSKLLMFGVYLLMGRGLDSNIEQERKDLVEYRAQYFPLFTTLLGVGVVILLQFMLFLTPGIYLYGYRVKSFMTLANDSDEYSLDLSKTVFSESVGYENGVLKLKESVAFQEIEPSEQPLVLESSENQLSNLKINGEDSLPYEEKSINYSKRNPAVIFKEVVEYSDLFAIREESSNQTFDSSVSQNINSDLENRITYQLSPDGLSWYFYDYNRAGWERATEGYLQSNLVQVANKFLEQYEESVGGKQLYIKVFFNSDGKNQLELKRLTVERELAVVDRIDNRDKETEYLEEEVRVTDAINSNLKINVSEAAYKDSVVTIEGTLNLDTEMSNEELEEYYVYLYYADFDENLSNYYSKGRYIGKAKVQEVEIEDETVYIFKFISRGVAETYLTGELIEELDDNNRVRYTKLIKPVKIDFVN